MRSPCFALDFPRRGVHGGAPADTCHGGFSSKCQGGNTMSQRNYACDNIIVSYFGEQDFEAVGELAFKKQLWQCMVGQALLIKSDIEARRAQNQFGIIVWQLNEIWPTGTRKRLGALRTIPRERHNCEFR
jgi:beta-mannosidase